MKVPQRESAFHMGSYTWPCLHHLHLSNASMRSSRDTAPLMKSAIKKANGHIFQSQAIDSFKISPLK